MCVAVAISSSARSGIIAGCVIGGLLLLAGGGWWMYRRHQKQQADTKLHSMAMQQQPASHYIPSHSSSVGGTGVAPGVMMALVCCLAVLAPDIVLPVAGSSLTKAGMDLAHDAAMQTLGSIVFIASLVIGAMVFCCPAVFLRAR